MFVALETRPFIYTAARRLQREATNSMFRCNTDITRYFKVGDAESARKLFVEMPQKNAVTWNCMISGYVRKGMIREACETFDSMPCKNIVSWTAMLTGYAKNGRLDAARSLFDSIENKNIASWNAMISGYVSNGMLEEARQVFDAVPEKNDVTWATMIEGYFRYSNVDEAERLFIEASGDKLLLCNTMIAKYGEMGLAEKSWDVFTRMTRRDEASWTSIINCFLRFGDMDKARRLFDDMPKKDVVAWTVMIKGYIDNSRIDLARELFDRMPHKDVIAWNSMLSGYAHYSNVKDSHDFFTRMEKRNTVSWNLMLRAYVLHGDITKARAFFKNMPRKDETSWNTLISGFQSDEEALSLYTNMLSYGFKPDQGTLTSVASTCGTLALHAWGRSVHACIAKTGYGNDSTVASSLVSMYSKCGFFHDASMVFETMPNWDTIAWNSMILAKAHHRSAEEALCLFRRMVGGGFKPDHVTFLGLLAACAHSGSVRLGMECFHSMERWNLKPRAEHVGSMVDLLARSGLIAEAFELKFTADLVPSYAWETLLSACSIHRSYELSDSIAEKILACNRRDGAVAVLRSNVLSARGMWKDAARVRAELREKRLRKEVGCSWIDVNGVVSCFSSNDTCHVTMLMEEYMF